MVMGPQPKTLSAKVRPLMDLIASVHSKVRPRSIKIPLLSDADLSSLKMPVLGKPLWKSRERPAALPAETSSDGSRRRPTVESPPSVNYDSACLR